MKKLILILLIAFILPLISSSCSEGQIDINTASLSELDLIKGVGPSTAEEIINSRPFNSVDDLIDVKYIGESRLADIKEQDLACVDEENSEKEIVEEIITKETIELVEKSTISKEELPKEINLSPIILNPKDIKSDNNVENNKERYAIYGFIAFCILLASLFLIRYLRTDKNEFG